ncbi:MAG: BrnT family toxin [Acidobacteria bacterium]|nr:BrnT family toxin [Acidobacteriota bacterium]MCI0722516.1 BrnT family toxin [Acidobacteriota bacterium]
MYDQAMIFEWDAVKDWENQMKHGVSFEKAQLAFHDPWRVIRYDKKHSTKHEKRFYCYGAIRGRVLTVRFCRRQGRIRIFGAAYTQHGREEYEKKNPS